MYYLQTFLWCFIGLSLAACDGSSSRAKTPPVSSIPFPLNDTGTTYCRNAAGITESCITAPPQDGNTGRDALAKNGALVKLGDGAAGLDLTKLDANGEALAIQNTPWSDGGNTAEGSQWHCVRDNHTGLIWETKNTNNGGLNHPDWSYQWHQPNAPYNGGYAGEPSSEMCGPIPCNTDAFVTALNTAQLCGINTWRLPTVDEHLSLVVTDNFELAIDNHYFPHTHPSHYWTSQSYAPNNSHAWYFYFSDGSPANTLKNKPMFLRLVHRPPSTD